MRVHGRDIGLQPFSGNASNGSTAMGIVTYRKHALGTTLRSELDAGCS
jgi:hypothetical protein